MRSTEPRLFDIFDFLRRRGVPIGLGDYRLAIDVLKAGVGLDSGESFRLALSLVWTKSPEDGELLDEALALLASPRPVQRSPVDRAPQQPAPTDEPQSSRKPTASGTATTTGQKGDTSWAEQSPNTTPTIHLGVAEIETVFLDSVPFVPSAEAPESSGTYLLTPRLPIERREMAAIWRHLRRPLREGPHVELDVEGTVDRFGRFGVFLGPVLQAARRNQLRLLCLVDRSATMEPFAPLVEALLESTVRGGLLGRMTAYFFDGVPDRGLRCRDSEGRVYPAQEFLIRQASGASALIVSDAGAALGLRDDERTGRTHGFLRELEARTYRAAWLNPLPREFWDGTPAAAIARVLPMYPLTREGLIDAVDILRGRPFPPGVGPNVTV